MSLSDKAVALLKNNAEIREILSLLLNEPIIDDFIKIHTSPPVRFKDFHGNEVRIEQRYWFVDRYLNITSSICHETSGMEPSHTYFSTEQAAKDWIELNKPCLSVQDVVDWATTTQAYSSGFSKELLELIRKKEAK